MFENVLKDKEFKSNGLGSILGTKNNKLIFKTTLSFFFCYFFICEEDKVDIRLHVREL